MRKSHYSLQNQIFLALLKGRRCACGLRQRELGTRLGRNQAMVSKVESGERRLDVIELRTWLSAMGEDFVAFVAELDDRLKSAATTQGSIFPMALGADENGENAQATKKKLRTK